MLNIAIFLPLATGLIILALPGARPRLVRRFGLVGALLTLAATLILWAGYDPAGPSLQWRTTLKWIPAIGAGYDVAVNGLSLSLVTLTALLLTLVMISVVGKYEQPKANAFLFLLMSTGLMGVFSSRDLLLFYLFFEVGLVPMYFIIGIWGHEQRRYAAIKFFLYTRAGSLAMLLAFLALYLSMDPHTFSLEAIAQARPLQGSRAADFVLLGLLLGFGVKLPAVPIHNWLPDAHVEAPTEGSVMLAGVQLKMGAYGLIGIMLPVLPDTVREYGWTLMVIAVVSLVYGALAALAQSDLKRMIAYTSINHMGYVMLAVAVWALADSPAVRQLGLNGAGVQVVSHGLLTGGMFFLAGFLQDRAHTREMDRFGGLLSVVPVYSMVLGMLAFGSLGLPGFSGFIAEFQAIGAALSVSIWAAVLTLFGLIVMTGLYILMVVKLMMGSPPGDMPRFGDLKRRELWAAIPALLLSLAIGVLPRLLLDVLENTTRLLARIGG